MGWTQPSAERISKRLIFSWVIMFMVVLLMVLVVMLAVFAVIIVEEMVIVVMVGWVEIEREEPIWGSGSTVLQSLET